MPISSRTLVMNRIKAALAIPPAASMATPGPSGQKSLGLAADSNTLVENFVRRWMSVGGQVTIIKNQDQIALTLEQLLSGHQGQAVTVSPSAELMIPQLDLMLTDLNLTRVPCQPAEAQAAKVGITGVRLALAYSGSLVLDSGQPGDLTASLLPPIHLALVPVSRILGRLEDVPDYYFRQGWPRGLVLITGPSRTADIELSLVTGVHGPGKVHVILLPI